MSFGERLQALRRGSGMTQEEFAQQLKVSRQAVSKWESSRGYPEIEKIIYICNHYGVTMDELFVDEVPPVRQTTSPQPPAKPVLESQPLKKAFANFFSNLSPRNQQIFSVLSVLVVVVLVVLLTLLTVTISKGESEQLLPLELIWLGLLVAFAIGEAATVGLVSIWFAAGALAALICALPGGPLWLQIVLFIAVSALCMLAIRPLAARYFNRRVEPTNADRIIGTEAMVTEDINNMQATGAVRIGGITWSARTEDGCTVRKDTLVRVLRIEGVKVIVAPAEQPVAAYGKKEEL